MPSLLRAIRLFLTRMDRTERLQLKSFRALVPTALITFHRPDLQRETRFYTPSNAHF